MATPLGRVKLRSDNWLDERGSDTLWPVMFLERKFSIALGGRQTFEPPVCPGLQGIDRTALPELVYDVVCNLQLLLAARRHYDHVLPDFGLSTSDGQSGQEARVERLQREVPETFARYERRFALLQLDFDVDDAGDAFMKVTGRVPAAQATLVFRFGVVNRKIVELSYQRNPA
jgi:gene 25-like lysozyme